MAGDESSAGHGGKSAAARGAAVTRFADAVSEGRALAQSGWLDDELRSADDGFEMYYTSGTSGRPKGVVLTNANTLTHAHSAIREFGFTPGDTWAHLAPMYHLVDAYAIYALTWVGGTHTLQPTWDARAALNQMASRRVTATHVADAQGFVRPPAQDRGLRLPRS